MRRETLAEKAARLVKPAGGSEAPPAIAPKPSLLQSRSFISPVEKEALIERERARMRAAQKEFMGEDTPEYTEEAPEDVFDRLQSLARNGDEEDGSPPSKANGDREPPPGKKEETISSYDVNLLEMVDSISVEELILQGAVATELEIAEGFSFSVQSLRKADFIEIQEDVDEFEQGRKDPNDDDRRVYPSSVAVADFRDMRTLVQGLLGIKGRPLPSDWRTRYDLVAQLPSGAYDALLREYSRFLRAVSLVFPDDITKKKMEELRKKLKKA